MAIKVRYTTMIVKNMTESLEFYTEVMGFTVDSEFKPQPETRIVILNCGGGALLELIQNDAYDVGLYSIGTDVDDLDKTLEHLKSHGILPEGAITPTLVGRMAFVRDPNGINIALIEHSEH
ncbi:MAG: VOC family protein [Clostridiales bacterium]|nr:VOC family protein [Clostridiales bacterium]